MNNGDFFQLAQLAEASYADLWNEASSQPKTLADDVKAALMAKKFSDYQASIFVDNWSVITHQPNTASGFSSTLFQNKDGSYVLAFRGTEPDTLSSLVEDAEDILVDGIAIDQIVDLYNEWRRISESGYHAAYLETLAVETDLYRLAKLGQAITIGPNSWAAEAYIEYLRSRTDVIIDEPSGMVKTIKFEETYSSGLGLDIDPGNLTVTGHSLGGHLAVAFTRLFPEMGAYAFTVNGAGFATGEVSVPLLGLSAETNIRNLFGMLGGTTGFDSSKILNLYGDRYPEIVTDNGELGLYQQGGHLPIHIEHVSLADAFGHGGQGMTDSLAVYDLFIELDSGLQNGYASETFAKLKPIFEAASNDDRQFEGLNPKPNASLESLVNALAELFNTGVKIGEHKIDDRDSLYKAIDAIKGNLGYQQAAGLLTVQSLAGQSSGEIVARAQTDIAYRYALANLNPFAISGDDALYAQANAHGELDLYDPATGEGSVTEQYLKDRAAMLTWVNKINTEDIQPQTIGEDGAQVYKPQSSGAGFLFWDIKDSIRINVGENGKLDPYTQTFISSPSQRIVFGSDANDPDLEGSPVSDRIYGGAGDDTLTGNQGNDIIDADADNDVVFGGFESNAEMENEMSWKEAT